MERKTVPLDTRSFGPAVCPTCDEELEDVIRDGEAMFCPECGAPIDIPSEYLMVQE